MRRGCRRCKTRESKCKSYFRKIRESSLSVLLYCIVHTCSMHQRQSSNCLAIKSFLVQCCLRPIGKSSVDPESGIDSIRTSETQSKIWGQADQPPVRQIFGSLVKPANQTRETSAVICGRNLARYHFAIFQIHRDASTETLRPVRQNDNFAFILAGSKKH